MAEAQRSAPSTEAQPDDCGLGPSSLTRLQRSSWLTWQVLPQMQDTFLEALQSYLETYKLQTATAAKLWAAVSSSTGEDVSSWMEPWTYRSGYPLLTVSLQGLDVLVTQVCPLHT